LTFFLVRGRWVTALRLGLLCSSLGSCGIQLCSITPIVHANSQGLTFGHLTGLEASVCRDLPRSFAGSTPNFYPLSPRVQLSASDLCFENGLFFFFPFLRVGVTKSCPPPRGELLFHPGHPSLDAPYTPLTLSFARPRSFSFLELTRLTSPAFSSIAVHSWPPLQRVLPEPFPLHSCVSTPGSKLL